MRNIAKTFGIALVLLLTALMIRAQSQSQASASVVPQWQIDAGGRMVFDVASVKQNASTPAPESLHSNVPLDPMDVFTPTGGLFSTTEMPLPVYIMFAYKIFPPELIAMLPGLPKWAMQNRYDIQARAAGNPTKDQYRLMVQALLAERFKLVFHYETREVPVYEMVLDKPGKLGPRLLQHPADSPCSAIPQHEGPALPASDGYADICGVVGRYPARIPGRLRGGGRNVTLEMLIGMMINAQTGIDRPVIDKTGLTGRFDVDIEYSPEVTGAPANFQRDESGPSYIEAMKEQLGLKLEPTKGPIEFMIIDHIEEPSPN